MAEPQAGARARYPTILADLTAAGIEHVDLATAMRGWREADPAVDLFSARGNMPETLADVQQREKDIRYSSRTRLTTDRYRHLHAIRAAAERLAARLPQDLQGDPDLAMLRAAGPDCPVTLVHLIHRKEGFEGNSKDYEFSRLSMGEHWAAGQADAGRTLAHKAWKSRQIGKDGLQVFDLGAKNT